MATIEIPQLLLTLYILIQITYIYVDDNNFSNEDCRELLTNWKCSRTFGISTKLDKFHEVKSLFLSFCLFRCARDLSFLLFVSSPTICLVQCTECDVLVSEISVILFLKGSWYVKIWNQSIGKGLDKFGTEKVSEPGKKKVTEKNLWIVLGKCLVY